MSPALILITLICINFATQVSTGDTYRCPSEARMQTGFKRGDLCVTWIRCLGLGGDRFLADTFDDLCAATFLHGERYGFNNLDDVDWKGLYYKPRTVPMIDTWAVGGYFIRVLTKPACNSRWGGSSCSMQIDEMTTTDTVNRHTYWYFHPNRGLAYADGSDWVIHRFWPQRYLNRLIESRGKWLCPTYGFRPDKSHYYGFGWRCEEISPMTDHDLACLHSPYRNCNYKIVEHCHFDDIDEKWYKYAISVLSEAETPYGKPCPTRIPKEWKRECEKTCRGNWGNWSAEPSEEHLRCDTITRERFAPAESGAAPCNKSGPACCVARKLTKYNDSCTDFAYNTTINLRKKGCNNSASLGRDSHGHLKCVCPDRYIGIQCEEDVCEGTCLNGGTCVPARGKPHCFCRRGFTGSNCSVALKSCGESATCQNGGTCETLVIGAEEVKVCKCKDGYGGVTCEREVEKCKDDSCNYNGACREDAEYGTIFCTCYESYHGKHCEMRKGKLIELLVKPTTSNIVNIVIGFVLGFLMLTLCFGGAAVHHRRRRRRGGHSYESSYASTFSTAMSSRASTFSTAMSSRASTNSTAISKAFGRQGTVKTKKEDTRSLAKSSSKAVGISKVG
ncbi:hypothetical protein TTRE_0000282701 [Trichuris trichiura]|uniref:EGF-like domain-containing protein n=1 Tax=Trichuris trichiura TaxID=36087 RepID=A0A077Z239_TRITR|nr:hypothetical protein TTRE_0000282701 [Trichuris trichiura]